MTTPTHTPVAQLFKDVGPRLGMAALYLPDKLPEEESHARWIAVRLAAQFLRTAVRCKILRLDALVAYIQDDRPL